ncbi:hypothetical protein MY4824_005767 [Beauveria thailandica]
MTLKRKRSSSELASSPLSFTLTFSSPPSNSPSMMDLTPRMGLINPFHLNSRTLKRFRDNRPSQAEIHRESASTAAFLAPQPHYPEPRTCSLTIPAKTSSGAEHTLQLLYTAQQQQQQHQDAPSPCPEAEAPPELEQPQQRQDHNQQSLHRFWNIKSRPTAAPDTAMDPMHLAQP